MTMNIKTLALALVLGSSSIAAAAPVVRDHRDAAPATVSVNASVHGQLAVRPAIYPTVRPMPLPRPMPISWVTLANDAQLYGRTTIKVAPNARAFTRLQLRADDGRAKIDKVMITFGNGRTQIVNLDAKLSKRDRAISIDLRGDSRNIDRIVLVGRTHGRGAGLDVLAL
jgi:hypothetical protein